MKPSVRFPFPFRRYPAWAMGVGILLVILVGLSGYFYYQWQREKNRASNPTEAAKVEARALIRKIGTFMDLPVGEEPTVARVTDATKLSSQAFFAKAKNGDQVIIYTDAKLAILFDPVSNRIKNVAPVSLGNTATPSAAVAPTATSTVRVTPAVSIKPTVEPTITPSVQ